MSGIALEPIDIVLSAFWLYQMKDLFVAVISVRSSGPTEPASVTVGSGVQQICMASTHDGRTVELSWRRILLTVLATRVSRTPETRKQL